MKTEKFTVISEEVKIGCQLVTPDSGVSKIGAVCITGGGTPAASLYGEWQDFLATRGVSSVTFDARGIGSSGGEWSTKAGFDPTKRYNSQASRTADTVEVLRRFAQIAPECAGKLALIGSSMGGDVAIHAADQARRRSYVPSVGALVLKGSAAYCPAAHYLLYGERLQRVLRDTSYSTNGVLSENFTTLRNMKLPTQLIYARADETIDPEIIELYKLAVGDLPNSEVFDVGWSDRTKHGYFSATDAVSRKAKERTFERSAQFLKQRLT